MAVTAIARDLAPTACIVRMECATSTLAQVATAGYLAAQAAAISTLNSGTWEWLASDLILVFASDGHQFFEFSDFDTDLDLQQLPGGNGEVTLTVVSGNFTVFDGTLGALKDLGYLPSDASKTKVVMAGSAVQVGYLARFVDTSGTVDDTAGASIVAGTIQSGLAGTVGGLILYPATTAKGTLRVTATNNTGDTITSITNAAMGQASAFTIPDPGTATATFAIAPAALVSGNLVKASGTAGLLVDAGLTLINYTTIAITAAQFNGMYAAPKLLLAAQGANTLIVLKQLQLAMTYVSANYAAGGVAAVQYDSTALGAGVIASTTLSAATFQAAVSTAFTFNPGVVPLTFSTTVNKGLYLSNVTGAFTTGDSTFVAHLWYTVIATV